MAEQGITVVVNNETVSARVPGNRLLREFIREDLGLTGTKSACEDGMCGACSVHLDGDVVKSCLVLAMEVDGRTLTTIEGLASSDGLHPVQQAMIDNFGFQCGFCTPGFIMTIADILDKDVVSDPESLREDLVGNICRCTGYTRIIASVMDAAGRRDNEAAR